MDTLNVRGVKRWDLIGKAIRIMADRALAAAGDADRALDQAGRDRLLERAASLYRRINWGPSAVCCDLYRTMPIGHTA